MFGDELFKAGLISKKDLRKAKQKAKKERRQQQGNRKKKKQIQAEQKAQLQSQVRDQQAARIEARKKRESEQQQREYVHQIQQVLQRNQVVISSDRYFFWHPSADGKYCHKLYVSERVALDLRAGNLGIAVYGAMSAVDPKYVVIPRKTVQKVLTLDPDRIVFWNEHPPPDLPELQLYHLS